jgi:hypothetical protein
MTEEKEKSIQKGGEPQPQAPRVEGELSESSMEKVVGGGATVGDISVTKFADQASH